MMARRQRHWITQTLLLGMQNGAGILANGLAVPYKTTHATNHMTQQRHSWALCQRNENLCSHTKNLFTNVHNGFLCNSPKLESIQISFAKWMVRRTGAHLCQGTLLSNRKEWTIDPHNHLDESRRNHAEWKKPIPEGHLPYDSIDRPL